MNKLALALIGLTACGIDVSSDPVDINVKIPGMEDFIASQTDDTTDGVEAMHRIVDVVASQPATCLKLMDQTREALMTLFPTEEGATITFSDNYYIILIMGMIEEDILVTARLFDPNDASVIDLSTNCTP